MRLNWGWIIAIIFIGCNNSSKRIVYRDFDSSGVHWIVKKVYDEKGFLSTEELLTSDSVRNGYYKKWERNKLSFQGSYVDGQKEGSWIYKDAIGDTVKIENWFSGKKFGEQLDFFSRVEASGKPLVYKYSFFDLRGEQVFESRFDLNGQVKDLNGFPLYTVFNKSQIKPDSIFELTCFIGVPNPLNYFFTLKELDEKNKKIISMKEYGTNSTNQLLFTDFGRKCSVEKKYSISGNYTWQVNLRLTDIKGKTLINDSSNINVIVRE
jgi:hypothetical protein